MAASGERDPRVFRNQEGALIVAILGCVVVALGISRIIADWNEPYVATVDAAVLLPCAWFFFFRFARAGVYVTPSGVRVLNPHRTVHLAWHEIERFSIGAKGLLPRVGIAELTNGRSVGLYGVSAPNPTFRPGDRKAENIITDLNKRLERSRAASAPYHPRSEVVSASTRPPLSRHQ